MPRHLCFWFAGILFVLGGCTLAPEYERRAPPISPEWPAGDAYRDLSPSSGTSTVPEIPWQAFFPDEHLQAVIRTALDNNRDLRVAALNVERARALYGVQRAELAAPIHAVGSGTRQQVPADLSGIGKEVISERYSVNLGMTAWEIDFFGRIRSLKDQALEAYLATEQARRSARIAVMAEVAAAYLGLAAERENLSLARSTLAAQEETLRLIQTRYELGLSSELDVHRARTQVETARADIARFTRRAALAKNALRLLVGTPISVSGEYLPAKLDDIQPLIEIPAGLSSEVLLRRPDILAAEHRLKAANARIGAARAAFFPRISLTAAFGTASLELSRLFDTGQDTWLFAPQAVLPVFDARLWSAHAVTEAEKKIAVAEYEGAIQTAFREVSDALAVRGTIDRQLEAQKALVDSVSRTYRLSNIRYINGIDDYLSVLDAHRSLYAAEQVLISVRLARLTNQVRLYAVLGGGADGLPL